MRYFPHALLLLNIIFTILCLPLAYAQDALPVSTQQDIEEGVQSIDLSKEQKTTIIEFYRWSTQLPGNVIDLRTKLSNNEFKEASRESFPRLVADARDLQLEIVTARSNPDLQKMQVDSYRTKFNKLQAQIVKFEQPVTKAITKLSKWRNEWHNKKDEMSKFTDVSSLSSIITIEEQHSLSQAITNSLELLENKLNRALTTGKELAKLQIRLHKLNDELEQLNEIIYQKSTQRSSPLFLSGGFYKQLNSSLFIETYNNSKHFLFDHFLVIKNNFSTVIIVFFLLSVFCITISLSRHLVLPSSRWYPFATCPLATGIFVTTAFYRFFNAHIDGNFEEQWDYIITTFSLFAVYRLVHSLVNEKSKRKIFSRLCLFMIIYFVISILKLPVLLNQIFILGASIAALLLYLFQLNIKCETNWQLFARKSWGALPLLIIVATFLGYEQFATIAFTTFMSTFVVCLIVWMLYHLVGGLLEFMLKISPFRLLQENRAIIVNSLQPFIALIHLALCFAYLSVIWEVSSSLPESLMKLTELGIDIGGFYVSPGVILTIFGVLYGATLLSKAIQAILLQEILPRYHAEKGVQLSITRLVHYAVLTIGFLVMLNFLGFDVKQLTLLGGALGVGIGFGLQAIVNNFVSGLILLFERPVKVGDTIQVGTELGEVKNLGLRATIIQTFDNSEIVIPNGDLVTGQVTNWTLAERKVRVKIPVGVAYGSDVSKVLEILRTCAEQHPMVLGTPNPVALFLAFGSSSLDFELRFWIPEYLDKMTATSELNQTIESEFALNDIEIPFPQSDLHIRTVDSAAAIALHGQKLLKKEEGPELKEKNISADNQVDPSKVTS